MQLSLCMVECFQASTMGEKRTAVQLTETEQQPAPPRALLCTSEYLRSMYGILFKLAAQSLRLLLNL